MRSDSRAKGTQYGKNKGRNDRVHNTFGGQGQPMDIGQAKAQGLCFNCHQKGHMSRNCPLKRKAMVRQMWSELSEGDRAEMTSEFATVSDKTPKESDFSQPQQ